MNTRTDLPLPLTATLEVLPTKAGAIALYEGHPTADDAHGANAARGPRQGMQLPPMLLVHSVNASASAAEMAPLFDYYRQSRSVYALDLPGFGFSDRSDRT
jgi:pimeloyl-ACP methyl ester carboxylesterase